MGISWLHHPTFDYNYLYNLISPIISNEILPLASINILFSDGYIELLTMAIHGTYLRLVANPTDAEPRSWHGSPRAETSVLLRSWLLVDGVERGQNYIYTVYIYIYVYIYICAVYIICYMYICICIYIYHIFGCDGSFSQIAWS